MCDESDVLPREEIIAREEQGVRGSVLVFNKPFRDRSGLNTLRRRLTSDHTKKEFWILVMRLIITDMFESNEFSFIINNDV